MPTAVMMESSEKTASRSRIWAMTTQKPALPLPCFSECGNARGARAARSWLEEQEEAATQKDQVPERERVPPDGEDGVREGHEPRHDGEKAQTHRERKSEAHVEGLVLL